MEAYTGFAEVYDLFMDNIPYKEWCDYIKKLLYEYGISDGLLLDLGCGTGTLTELLSDSGFDMIGVDCSEDMLQSAIEKRSESGREILYLLQDMRSFELYGTVRAVISLCDSVNYITEYQDLVQVFRLVNNYLDPGGIFIFDLNTVYKYETILGDSMIAEDREEGSFIWENEYNQETKMNTYHLSIFIHQQENIYRKHEETHFQRAYSLVEIKNALEESGMEFITSYHGLGKEPVKEDSERIYIIARESGKRR